MVWYVCFGRTSVSAKGRPCRSRIAVSKPAPHERGVPLPTRFITVPLRSGAPLPYPDSFRARGALSHAWETTRAAARTCLTPVCAVLSIMLNYER